MSAARVVTIGGFVTAAELQWSAFSENRNKYAQAPDFFAVTGGLSCFAGALDAPEFIAGGCCCWFGPSPYGVPYITPLYLWRCQP